MTVFLCIFSSILQRSKKCAPNPVYTSEHQRSVKQILIHVLN